MDKWTPSSLETVTYDYNSLSDQERTSLLKFMNEQFPPQKYQTQLSAQRKAIENNSTAQTALLGATQHFPSFIKQSDLSASPSILKNHAIVLTAGGEGERLRHSLLEEGVSAEQLEDFTKATYRLPEFYDHFGTLHVNLCMISSICKEYKIDIPVIVTTGPQNSTTARVIPEILKKFNNFGLKYIRTLSQNERLHFTFDEKIVFRLSDGIPKPITQPDETGGPLMKLKEKLPDGKTTIEWLESLNCNNLIIIQATALYNQQLLASMAKALQSCDCLGVGILRDSFPATDPFGTFVSVCKNNQCKTMILEQEIRNEATRELRDPSGKFFLPFNTGFYAFTTDLLKNNDLPDYATPPKEILPSLPRTPKIGYAATEILPLAQNPMILTIDPEMFGVLKSTADLIPLSELGRRYGLLEMCKNIADQLSNY